MKPVEIPVSGSSPEDDDPVVPEMLVEGFAVDPLDASELVVELTSAAVSGAEPPLVDEDVDPADDCDASVSAGTRPPHPPAPRSAASAKRPVREKRRRGFFWSGMRWPRWHVDCVPRTVARVVSP